MSEAAPPEAVRPAATDPTVLDPPPSSGWRGVTRVPLTAVMFLTRLPCPSWVGHDAPTLSRSAVYFPAVGALVGLFGAAAYGAVALAFEPVVAAAAALAATVWLTGAFHEDALGDTFDGFGGGWQPDEILRIMRDSRLGTYGTVALVLTLGARWTALASLETGLVLGALVGAHVLARWTALPLILWLPYVRESGTGKPFAASMTPARLVGGTVIALGLAVTALGWALVPVGLTVVSITAVGGLYTRAKIGGMTGDVLGAVNGLAELAVYLVLLGDWSGAWAQIAALL
ncbi:MAG: adenosylcobinamide-GDP ribazoletransferase [Bacteroidota bacterium]